MLTEKQVKEIREHLENAQNPIFFFDNDPDGLCSFLLLRRAIGKGKGVPIKSFPELNNEYFRKVQELHADYIFILDKPIISKEFLKSVEENNMPLVWIDHHEVQVEIPEFVNYYNPILNKIPTNEPTTALCYQIIDSAKKKEDLWIGVVGCISDKFVPDFYDEFEKTYPDLVVKYKDAFDILYTSRIGEIIKIFSFGLKDRVTNVILMIKFLLQSKSPYDVLNDNSKTHTMFQRFKQINSKYKKLLKKAEAVEKHSKKMLLFQYSGDLSISSDLSNELSYKFPGRAIIVVYIKGNKANISARGKNIKQTLLKSIEELEGATGGGHDDAVGAQIKVEDIEKFRNNLNELLK